MMSAIHRSFAWGWVKARASGSVPVLSRCVRPNPWAAKSRWIVDGASGSSAGTFPESRTARMMLTTDAFGRSFRIVRSRSCTASGIARLTPASSRGRGLRPSKPIASYRPTQSRIVERPIRVRLVPGISHSRSASASNSRSFSPFASGPLTRSRITLCRKSALFSRKFSSTASPPCLPRGPFLEGKTEVYRDTRSAPTAKVC